MRDPSGIKKKKEELKKLRRTEDLDELKIKSYSNRFGGGLGGGQAIIRAWMGNDQTPYKRLEKYSMSRTEH